MATESVLSRGPLLLGNLDSRAVPAIWPVWRPCATGRPLGGPWWLAWLLAVVGVERLCSFKPDGQSPDSRAESSDDRHFQHATGRTCHDDPSHPGPL